MPNSKANLEELGALVRLARQREGYSMEDLAARAHVSRSSVHRIENGAGVRPQPQRLARVLSALEIAPDQVRNRLVKIDATWGGQVLTWMGRLESGAVEGYLEGVGRKFDLIAVRGENVVMLEVRGPEAGVAELTNELKASGWVVTRPA